MPLKITVDEDLPRQAVQLLREHGYDAEVLLSREWVDGKIRNCGLQFKKINDI